MSPLVNLTPCTNYVAHKQRNIGRKLKQVSQTIPCCYIVFIKLFASNKYEALHFLPAILLGDNRCEHFHYLYYFEHFQMDLKLSIQTGERMNQMNIVVLRKTAWFYTEMTWHGMTTDVITQCWHFVWKVNSWKLFLCTLNISF